MKNFLLKLLFTTLAIMVIPYFLPGVEVSNFWSALVVAIVLAILNVTLKPVFVLLTIPITLLTLGLFLLAINAFIIIIADKLVDGFVVSSFWYALGFSLILSFLSYIFNALGGKEKD